MQFFTRLKKTLVPFLVLLSFVLFPVAPVHAQTVMESDGVWRGVCVGESAYGAQEVPTIAGLECLVANILASAITVIGIVAFVMFLFGGFRYLTAGSNSKGVESGRNAISFAILGIVVALASFLLLRVIVTLTGVQSILNFKVGI